MNFHLTDSTPPWVLFVVLALVAAAYAACGLITLTARWRRRRWPRWGGYRSPAADLYRPTRREPARTEVNS